MMLAQFPVFLEPFVNPWRIVLWFRFYWDWQWLLIKSARLGSIFSGQFLD
jgi:hypothetical protein